MTLKKTNCNYLLKTINKCYNFKYRYLITIIKKDDVYE